MTPEKKSEIERLARASVQAQERANSLAMMNVASDPKERENQAVQYAIAQAEAYETRAAVQRAIESP